MQKIFDFDLSKITENTQAASSRKNEQPIAEVKFSKSSISSLIKNPKWNVVEPPRLVKSNMSLSANSSNLSTNSLISFKNNVASKINPSINNFSSSKSLVKGKLKTFEDVEIIMNDDQLIDFRCLIDKAFKRTV